LNGTTVAERTAARDAALVAEANAKLEKYRGLGYNIPGATSVEFKPYMLRPHIELVTVDPNPPAGDIRYLSGGKYELTAQALKRFRIAGNITFSEPKTTEVRKNFIEVEVTGKRFKLNGKPDFHPDKKSIDLEAYEENQRRSATRKVNDKDSPHRNKTEEEKTAIVERKVREAVASRRAYLRECAVTGAQSRVIIKLLGLKAAYTIEELKKPFVIVSLIPDTNNEDLDPEVKRMLTCMALDITELMFQTGRGITENYKIEEIPAIDHAALSLPVPACVSTVICDDEFSEYPRDVQEQILKRMFQEKNLPLIPFEGLKTIDLLALHSRLIGS